MEDTREQRKQALKKLLKEMHTGANPEKVKPKLEEYLKNVKQEELCQAEEELVQEGMPREKIQALCNVHINLLKQFPPSPISVPPGHPVHTFMQEHAGIEEFVKDLRQQTARIAKAGSFDAAAEDIKQLKETARNLMEVETHNVREENVLFPYLEKHGITGPPAVMWSEHDALRQKKKELHELLKKGGGTGFKEFASSLKSISEFIDSTITAHMFKENNVLYPMAVNAISDDEWEEIRKECDELGYCCMAPDYIKSLTAEHECAPVGGLSDGRLQFETGALSKDEIEALFSGLPVDVTFVDRDDKVRFFTKSEGRIFLRTKAVIGRGVQQCHPEKSIHVVNQILSDFKSGKRKSAEFWIKMGGRLIHIRYFPITDKDRNYAGCIEVTQDVTDIQKLSGEKRLL